MSDCEWKQEQIRCHLDASQHGLVVAWSISRPSNPVNLTRWKIRFKFTHSVDLAHVKLGSIQGGSVTDASCIFRADVHEHRLKPGEPPVRRAAFEVYPAKNSTAEWTTIGQRFQIGKLSGTGSGSGTVKTIAYVGSEATAKDPAGSFLVCEGRLDPAKGFELSFRIQDKVKVHVPGAKNADFVDMVTGLGRSQDGLDDDAVIAKHLLRDAFEEIKRVDQVLFEHDYETT